MKFNKLIPELTVSDIEKCKQFYTDILGFKIEYERLEISLCFCPWGRRKLCWKKRTEIGVLENLNILLEME